jgi:hypothetical protein
VIYFAAYELPMATFDSTIELVKIGYTRHVSKRIAQLRRKYKTPESFVAGMPGGLTEEKSMHRKFNHLRIRNRPNVELFYAASELLEFMGRLPPTDLSWTWPDLPQINAMSCGYETRVWGIPGDTNRYRVIERNSYYIPPYLAARHAREEFGNTIRIEIWTGNRIESDNSCDFAAFIAGINKKAKELREAS